MTNTLHCSNHTHNCWPNFLSWAAIAALIVIASPGPAQETHQMGDRSSLASANVNSQVPFATLMSQAMSRMDQDMSKASMTGDPDHDFLVMMIPHHQGAVDMAKAILLNGTDPRIRNLAQGMITDQEIEIELMRNYLTSRVGHGQSHP